MHGPASFPCAWLDANAEPCSRRAAAGARHCRWHEMAGRISGLWEWPTDDEAGHERPWAKQVREYLPVVLAGFAIVFCRAAVHHAVWFRSGLYPEREVEYDPQFIFLFLGIGLALGGVAVSALRTDPLAQWLEDHLAGLLLLLTGGAAVFALTGLGRDDDPVGEAVPWLLLGVGGILIRADRRTGRPAPALVLAGLGAILLSGVTPFTMEFLHQATGGFEYIKPWLAAEQRATVVANKLATGFTVVVAAADALVALAVTGRMLVPLQPDRWTLSLISAFGQGNVLRHMLLLIFGQYLIDVALFPGMPPPLPLLLVFVVHLRLLRRSAHAAAGGRPTLDRLASHR